MAEEVTLNNLLVNEIGSQIEALGEAEVGTETHEKIVKDISTLYKVFNEEYDLNVKYEEIGNKKTADEARLNFEKEKLQLERDRLEFEKDQLDRTEKENKRNKIIECILFGVEQIVKVGCLVGTCVAYRNRFREGLEFETNGSVSSKFFSGLTSKMKLTKVD